MYCKATIEPILKNGFNYNDVDPRSIDLCNDSLENGALTCGQMRLYPSDNYYTMCGKRPCAHACCNVFYANVTRYHGYDGTTISIIKRDIINAIYFKVTVVSDARHHTDIDELLDFSRVVPARRYVNMFILHGVDQQNNASYMTRTMYYGKLWYYPVVDGYRISGTANWMNLFITYMRSHVIDSAEIFGEGFIKIKEAQISMTLGPITLL